MTARTWYRIGLRLLVVAAVLGLWQLLCTVGAVDSITVSSPSTVWHQVATWISDGSLWPTALHTLVTFAIGYGLGVQQVFNPQTGIIWDYEGQAFGARVLNLYFPRTGMSIALAVNSSTITNDDLSDLSSSVYQTLQNAGATPGS